MANETLWHSLARYFPFGFTNERSGVDLCKKGVIAIVLGPEMSERENTTSCLKRSLYTRYKLLLLILGRGWPKKPDFFGGVRSSPYGFIMGFRPSSHLRILFHQTTSGQRRLSNTYVTPSFFHANNMQIKINIPQAEQVDLRLVSGLCSLLSLSWDSLTFAYLLAFTFSQSTCGKST